MGNQVFMYIVLTNNKRLSITKRLYNEMIADTNGRGWNEARRIILSKINECPNEVQQDKTNKKVDIDLDM